MIQASASGAVQFQEFIQVIKPITDNWLALTQLATLIISIILFSRRFGSFETKFKNVEDSTQKLKDSVEHGNKCIVELQTYLRAKNKFTFNEQTLGIYGVANSPIVLNPIYKPYIIKSGLEKEIKENNSKLVDWLKSKHPNTGLDAQSLISELVTDNSVESYINTSSFKQYLYKKGKSPADYYGILAVYLFEILIPQVVKE